MRTIKNIPNIAKETDLVKFPDSTIVNETSSQEGTPVVREIYGDFVTNFYAFLRDRKITANDIEDNETNGYQIIQALKRNISAVDLELSMDRDVNGWFLNIDFSFIDAKTVLIARTSKGLYDPQSGSAGSILSNFTIRGTDGVIFNQFSSTGFNAGDEVAIILNGNNTRIISLSKSDFLSSGLRSEINIIGAPISFTEDGNNYIYNGSEIIYNDLTSFALLSLVQSNYGLDVTIVDLAYIQGAFLLFLYDESLSKYFFVRWSKNQTSFDTVTVNGFTLPATSLNEAKMYVGKSMVYISNKFGTSPNDYEFHSFNFALQLVSGFQMVYDGEVSVENTFVNSSNYWAISTGIILVDSFGDLQRYGFNNTLTKVGTTNGNLPSLYTKMVDVNFLQIGNVGREWK